MISTKRPTPPGEFIKEDILKELSITQEQLARSLNVSRRTISQLVNGKRKISVDIALRLDKFTKTSPEMWLNLQAAIDIWDAHHSQNFNDIKKIQAYAA